MAMYQFSGATPDANNSASTAPLVVLFERDDAVAVPLLSQLRLAGYDVRAARTPVELFDLTGKHPVSLVLVDLGNATAGRREFWVALDAQRRGRSMRVMTFRYNQIASLFDNDFEQSARAVADVDVNGPHEFQRVIDGVRQRLAPTESAMGAMGATSMPGLGGGFGAPPPYMPYMQNPTAAPGFAAPAFGASGMFAQSPSYAPTTPPPFQSFQASPFSAYPDLTAAPPSPFAYPADPYAANPFSSDPYAPYAQPSLSFPGMPPAGPFAPPAQADSPFAQPYSQNPFAADLSGPSNARPGAAPFGGPSAPASQPAPFAPASVPNPASFEARAAHYSDIYAAQFGIADAPPQQSFERLTPPAPLDWAASPPFTPGLPNAGNGFGNSFAARASDPFDGSRAGFDVGSNPQYGYAPNGYAPTTAQPDPAPFSDVWTPPDGSQDADTGILYAAAHDANRFVVDEPEAFQQTARVETPDPFPAFFPREQPGRTEHAEHIDLMEPSESRTRQDTAPYQAPPSPPSRPPVTTGTPTDRALGSVLVEGALLTPQKLEALKGVQQMLSSVDMRFKLGELALLFKFLSQDQLLAALLVSRGLVSPEQIAGLGRVKQELAATGEEHDLDTLLDMFHILPPEQLRQLRTELGDIQAQVR